MSRVPLRTRLALAFAVVMAVLLGATGLFLYLRLAADLDRTLDRELSARVAGVVAIVRDDGDDLGDPTQDPLDRVDDEGFVQVLDASGAVADATAPELVRTPVVSPADTRRLTSGETPSLDVYVPQLDESLRLKAAPATDDRVDYTVLVGASLDQREAALQSLVTLLLIGGPIALGLASLAGYGVASGALRPVEAMRRRAAAISATEPGHRLPVPRAHDEIARLGETLNEMLDRLESAFERERSFVSDASHELRTPLTILKTELALARRSGRTIEELQAALDSAADETDRLAQLAEDLLVIARADEGRLPVRLAETDVGDVIDRVSVRFTQRAAEAGRVLAIADGTELRVQADGMRLEQALSNMVDNALRYGGGAVTFRATEHDGSVNLHVTDEGKGFPDDLLPSAFERFTRADHARSRGGAGLGLAIVAAIARAHGGTAHARNHARGADVWLSLPRGAPAPISASEHDRSRHEEPEWAR